MIPSLYHDHNKNTFFIDSIRGAVSPTPVNLSVAPEINFAPLLTPKMDIVMIKMIIVIKITIVIKMTLTCLSIPCRTESLLGVESKSLSPTIAPGCYFPAL